MANLISEDTKTEKGKKRKRKRNYLLREESIGSNFESTNSIIQEIGGLSMNRAVELEILKDVLFDYSSGLFPFPTGDYWSFEFWQCICVQYNRRANLRGLPSCTAADINTRGSILQTDYCMHMANGFIDADLRQIFERCENCKRRIPVFPSSLFPQSHSGYTISTVGSYRSGGSMNRNPHSGGTVGNLNGTNTSVQSTKVSAYDVDKLLDVLEEMMTSGQIDGHVFGIIVQFRLPKWNSDNYCSLVKTLLRPSVPLDVKKAMVMREYEIHSNANQ